MAALLVSSAPRHLLFLLALSVLTAFSLGLKVTPGSACAAYCMDDANGNVNDPGSFTTNSSDIVCNNVDYWSSTRGTKFRMCLDCLQNSTAVNGTENDVAWYLYNLRYAVDVCLFSYPTPPADNSSTSSPCALTSNCQPLQKALAADSLKPSNESEFGYCSAGSGTFVWATVNNCIQCLQSDAQQTYLGNFLTALWAGCKQTPPAGDLLGLSGTLFGTTALAIVTPSWNQTAVAAATPVTSLSTGTVVGIAMGTALLVIGAVALFFLHWRRQKRSKEYRFGDSNGSEFRQASSISSSMNGGAPPYYTTDYKKPASDQRNFELYDKIKTQYVVVPQPTTNGNAPQTTATLWGRDTPRTSNNKLPAGSKSQAGAHSSTSSLQPLASTDNTSSGLADMPTHPAFIPRAFTRGSRIPPALATEERVKSNKPDIYAAQQYIEAAEDPSTIDVAALDLPQLMASETTNTAQFHASNPFSNPRDSPDIPPPPPGPPHSQADWPRIAPTLEPPSLSRVRGTKKYVPPPLKIAETKPKARRTEISDEESGKP